MFFYIAISKITTFLLTKIKHPDHNSRTVVNSLCVINSWSVINSRSFINSWSVINSCGCWSLTGSRRAQLATVDELYINGSVTAGHRTSCTLKVVGLRLQFTRLHTDRWWHINQLTKGCRLSFQLHLYMTINAYLLNTLSDPLVPLSALLAEYSVVRGCLNLLVDCNVCVAMSSVTSAGTHTTQYINS